ncbi:MAG: TIGR01777 family protein [Opitutaceae bacterium]|nr:TIGR01777 family protein [Opitutaceae bacterium]
MTALPAKILIAGASGLIGTALGDRLRARGHEVRCLVRHAATKPHEYAWDPASGRLDDAALRDVNVVINLAGVNVAAGRWTKPQRDLIRSSRVASTRLLVDAMARCRVRPQVLINASAAGFYGDTQGRVVDETAVAGAGFLAQVCREWEAEARRAEAFGVRTVCLRLGVVLSATGGALAKMLPVFRMGLGGRLGSGRQTMSWIALGDLLAVFDRVLADEALCGPINAVAPSPVSNAVFTRELARALGRPAMLPVPAWALRLTFGQMADEALYLESL